MDEQTSQPISSSQVAQQTPQVETVPAARVIIIQPVMQVKNSINDKGIKLGMPKKG